MIEWIKDNLLPFEIVPEDRRGVRLKRGEYIETLDRGCYWYWPLFDEIQTLDIKSQLIDLPDKTITDKNGTTWAVSGSIEYFVVSPKKALLEVQEYDEAVQNYAVVLVSEAVYRGMDMVQIVDHVLGELPEKAEEWGLEVTGFWINELSRCKVLRIMGIG